MTHFCMLFSFSVIYRKNFQWCHCSGVAWPIWLRMQFLVCVSMTSSCSVNSGTIDLQKLRSNCDSNTMLYLSEFQLLHTGPDLADARP